MKFSPECSRPCLLPLLLGGLMAVAGHVESTTADDATVSKAEPAFDAEQLTFFESKILPVLVEQCYKCHSTEADPLQGGLFLDSREGVLAGGDSGAAVVVGRPGDSLLMEAIRHESYEMPPDSRLPDAVIADFERWIRDGLVDPRTRPTGAPIGPRVLYTQEAARMHWAFQPLTTLDIPKIDDVWVRTPIDAFVLTKLRKAGIEPSPPADPRTLLRRVSYGLTGLPPSFDDVRAFEVDHSQTSYEDKVERLLESPRYGENWARHWLDIARYADTNGQRPAPTPEPPFFPFAWVYRDYVIDAFNRDLPFDQFIVEQLAGDQIATEDDRRPLAALGFLRVGKTFGQNIDDRIDDRIDVISKGFLGLTVACARCHDHKLDPISQADYYALHGVLASSEEFDALLTDPHGIPEFEKYEGQKRRLTAEIQKECVDGINGFLQRMTQQVAHALIAVEQYRDGALAEENPSLAAREVAMKPLLFKSWVDAVDRWEEQDTPAYRPWFAFTALTKDEFATKSPAIIGELEKGSVGGRTVPEFVAKHFQSRRPKSLDDVAAIYQEIFIAVEKAAGGQYPMASLLCAMEESPGLFREEHYDHPGLPQPLGSPEMEALRQVTLGFGGPYFMTPREMMQLGASQWRKAMVRRMHEVDRLEADHPGAPIKAMGLRDREQPVDSPIFIRGDKSLPGDVVPRRFLRRLSHGNPQLFTRGSGRLELARAIASPENPMTARVIANRIWQWHFGRGLVSTPSDFGLNGERPTHPELLDWLAGHFIKEGWSIKALNRLILSSSVYQQSSLLRAEAREIDSENRLLWRMSPRRMTFEQLRDTWLTAAGTLQHRTGGRPVDPLTDDERRSIYMTIDRYRLPDVFPTFDFAPPEFTTATRDSTIIPQQALFAMNSEWLIERGQDLADRQNVVTAPTPAEKVRVLYTIVYQRFPTKAEMSLALRFLRSHPGVTQSRLAHALLQTNEVSYIH